MNFLSKTQQTLFTVFICVLAIVLAYIVRGVMNNEVVSFAPNDWLDFAEFVSLLASPVIGLGAAILISQQIGSSTRVKQLEVIDRKCAKLDGEIQRQLEMPFCNPNYPQLEGMTILRVVYRLDNNSVEVDENLKIMLSSLLQNIAINFVVVQRNRELLKKLDVSLGDEPWLEHAERSYWISRYSAILRRFHNIIGEDVIRAKFKDYQITACAEISPAFVEHAENT